MTSFVHVAGHAVERARVVISHDGPWFATLDFEDDAVDLEGLGQVELVVDDTALVGTIDSGDSGTFGLQRKVRVIGGGGGWGNALERKIYHNDAGVKARNVADDAARESGETIGDFEPSAVRVGVDYVRETGFASRVLEEVIGSASWWVGLDGLTHVGTRPTSEADPELHQVLRFDPRSKLATIAVDGPAVILPGTTISETLDAPETVRDVVLHITPDGMRCVAWCGSAGRSRAARAVGDLVRRFTDSRLHGIFEYRVVNMAGGRVNLQAVTPADGLPDILPGSMLFGIPGVEAELTPGSQVLVGFVGGRRTLPVVTHYRGAGSPGYVPVSLNICNGTEGAARKGDTVEVPLPPMLFTGTINGAVASGVLASPVSKTVGAIVTCSSKVKIG